MACFLLTLKPLLKNHLLQNLANHSHFSSNDSLLSFHVLKILNKIVYFICLVHLSPKAPQDLFSSLFSIETSPPRAVHDTETLLSE